MVAEARVAVITGAGKGIGRSAALLLAEQGIRPIIVDIDAAAADAVAAEVQELGVKSDAYVVDVSEVEPLKQMIDAVLHSFGRVDILVNNAGVLSKAGIADLTEAEWDRVMNVNVKSAAFLSQKVLASMRERSWGRIVNVSSLAGRCGGQSAGTAYAASKAALIGLTMSTAKQAAKAGITVNAVAPGPTDSELFRGFTPQEIKGLEASIPVGSLGTPEQVASVIAFLCSDAAAFVTGAVWDVNGGMFMG